MSATHIGMQRTPGVKRYTLPPMDSANTIRDAMTSVALLRSKAKADPALGESVAAVKRFQANRFRRCYADLLSAAEFGAASRFFLDELYGEADYAERDQQFARIAATLATVFPAAVVGTAVALSRLHLLTEQLDHQMAEHCLLQAKSAFDLDAASYLAAWRCVGRRADRQYQLESVLELGRELADLTRKPGLLFLLKLMHRPAKSAGLASLQQFLERGFEIFAMMSRSKGKVAQFLSTIETRESNWLNLMFEELPGDASNLLSSLSD